MTNAGKNRADGERRASSAHAWQAQPLAQMLLIIAAAFWVYWPVLHGDWIWDDGLYITRNPLLHDPQRLWKAWFVPGSFMEYYPIEQSVQWLQWQLWGNDTFGYHFTNVVLHIVSSLLVWRLLTKLGLRWAWLGGFIFAIHPLMVESVAWISELKNTLSLPPLLLAMCAWIDYDAHRTPRDYVLALGFFLVSLLCKVTGVGLPLIFLLYAWWKYGRVGWRDVVATLPFFAISFVLTHLIFQAGQVFGQAQVIAPELLPIGGFASRLALAGLAAAFYFSKTFLPVNLMPLYPLWSVDPPALLSFLPWLFFFIVAGVSWWKCQSWGRHVLLGLGFFLINVAPFLAFGYAFHPRDTWVMNHFMYMPVIGLLGVAVAGAEDLSRQLPFFARRVLVGLIALASLLMIWGSRAYAGVYFSQETLWTYAVEHNAGTAAAHNNLGVVDLGKGLLPEASTQFTEAIALRPDFLEPHNGLGNVLVLTGHLPEAIAEYREALRIVPNAAEVLNGLANALLQQRQFAEALAQAGKAVQLSPDYADAHCTLGLAFAQTGRLPEAIAQFEIAQRLKPDDPRIAQVLDQLRAATAK